MCTCWCRCRRCSSISRSLRGGGIRPFCLNPCPMGRNCLAWLHCFTWLLDNLIIRIVHLCPWPEDKTCFLSSERLACVQWIRELDIPRQPPNHLKYEYRTKWDQPGHQSAIFLPKISLLSGVSLIYRLPPQTQPRIHHQLGAMPCIYTSITVWPPSIDGFASEYLCCLQNKLDYLAIWRRKK